MNAMKSVRYRTTFLLSFLILSFSGLAQVEIVQPVCEYKVNPIGIDVERPRLSWKLSSGEQDVKQSAYEIRVAASVADLKRKSQLIWTSGKVDSDRSVNVAYEGPALESMQRAYWQVRVWDENGKVGKWSTPGFWEMGILTPGLWSASWISMKEKERGESSLPAHYYRKEFKALKNVKQARIYITAL